MAIVKPEQMDFSGKKFSMIICGAPGIGKTTLAFSAPNPVLVDLDRGISRVEARHRKDTDVVATYEELLEDMDAFKDYETVVIDTGGSLVTYLQDWAIRKDPVNRQKNGAISLKGFGAVKAEFIRITNYLKDILNKNIIYIFHTQEEKDKEGNIVQRLLCEGAARNIVWQPCDLGAYMRMQGNKRQLCFTPTDEYFAKGCHGIHGIMDVPELKENVPNDFLAKLFDAAKKSIEKDKDLYAEERANYDEIMSDGTAIIEGITNAETCKAALVELGKLRESLTSKVELNAAFKAKLKELGLKWNQETKRYE